MEKIVLIVKYSKICLFCHLCHFLVHSFFVTLVNIFKNRNKEFCSMKFDLHYLFHCQGEELCRIRISYLDRWSQCYNVVLKMKNIFTYLFMVIPFICYVCDFLVYSNQWVQYFHYFYYYVLFLVSSNHLSWAAICKPIYYFQKSRYS